MFQFDNTRSWLGRSDTENISNMDIERLLIRSTTYIKTRKPNLSAVCNAVYRLVKIVGK